MTAPSPTLFPYEGLSLQQICTQPVKGKIIESFSGALTTLSRILSCEEINLYIATPYETGEVLKLAERASIFDRYRIEPALGCSIDMSIDAECGEYDNMSSMLTRIMTDSLLNCLRFSREEMAKSRTLKDLAVRMGLVADRTPESYKELLQRFHVGELKPSLNERLLQSRKEAEAKGQWSFEPVVNMPQTCSDTSDIPLEDQLVSVLVEDMLEHSLPYIHAVPLFVAVKAYGITCKRVSLLCSIYLENAIYRGKDPSAQSLIPDSEKRYIVGKLKAVLDEIPTLTTLSEQKESTLRGEINRGYYKILSAFISKKDLREFMRLAGERQTVEAEGLPLNYCEGVNHPVSALDNMEEPQGVPQDVCHEYEKAAESETKKGKRKDLLAIFYYAQGFSIKEIAQKLALGPDKSNLLTRIRNGRKLMFERQLTDLTPYLEKNGRHGSGKNAD